MPDTRPWPTLAALQQFVHDRAQSVGFAANDIITAVAKGAAQSGNPAPRADATGQADQTRARPSGSPQKRKASFSPANGKPTKGPALWCNLHQYCAHTTEQCHALKAASEAGQGGSAPPSRNGASGSGHGSGHGSGQGSGPAQAGKPGKQQFGRPSTRSNK
jgi:hypothetical protein